MSGEPGAKTAAVGVSSFCDQVRSEGDFIVSDDSGKEWQKQKGVLRL
jgi:hypothetical protein